MHRRNPGEGISTGCLAVFLKQIHTLVMYLDPAIFVSILKSIPFSSLSVLMALVVNDIQFSMMILLFITVIGCHVLQIYNSIKSFCCVFNDEYMWCLGRNFQYYFLCV